MKRVKIYIQIFLSLLVLSSCAGYLDVQPEDKLLEEDVFDNETGIQNALNGVYTGLSGTSLYGGSMTMTTVEVLGQQFDVSDPDNGYRYVGTYEYDQSSVESKFSSLWTQMYKYILNDNSFISGIEDFPDVLTEEEHNLLKGEAYGIRAFTHFDLLRLFGPVYSTNSSDLSIPYVTEAESAISPIIPASDVIEMVLADLDSAEVLLENDPIRKYGTIYVTEDESGSLDSSDPLYDYNGSDFYRFRNLRFNYYAVKALQARVNLYAGNNEAAKEAALAVVEEAGENGKNWFPWVEELDVIAAGDNPDLIFSSEVIFGIQNRSLYTTYNNVFNSSVIEDDILTPLEGRLDEMFDDKSDIRTTLFEVPNDASKTYETFVKFEDVASEDQTFQYMQPLIRLSEMYYILAETTGDVSYLNLVAQNRNLLDATGDLQTEIQKEYKREFYGEGQMFFYYKRLNIGEIANGSSASADVTMTDAQYVVPLPESETDDRN